MTGLPVVSAKDAIKAFMKIGYQVVRQRGSHIRLHHSFDKRKRHLQYQVIELWEKDYFINY